MHVGHGRWAATGNALCNVLQHAGWNVTREFYINDAGHQMDVFGHSVGIRYLELCGENIEHPDEFYGGAYVIDIARAVLRDKGDSLQHASESERDGYCREFGYDMMLGNIRSLCKRIGCGFDTWFSERTLYVKDAESGYSPIDSVLQALDTQDYLYEKEGATWLRTTDFGDDKDRVLIKTDGTYTYFLPDIAYHNSKIARGDASVIANSENATAAQAATTQTAPAQGTKLIDIWGADHHGYIKRMQSAMQALGHTGEPTVVLGQLVNLFRNGEPVRMSKRTGEMVTFEELVDEVGTDATLYLLLTRSTDQPIDFDIEAAKKQDATNPVYYVQYAHARICSILRKSQTDIAPDANLALLTDPAELDLAREMARLQDVVAECAQDLAPFHLTHYAQDLATAFHHFYTQCRVISDDAKLTAARLYLCAATKSVLALTLNLLGVSAPESM
jgi:arginyl-tRNA synthetase